MKRFICLGSIEDVQYLHVSTSFLSILTQYVHKTTGYFLQDHGLFLTRPWAISEKNIGVKDMEFSGLKKWKLVEFSGMN